MAALPSICPATDSTGEWPAFESWALYASDFREGKIYRVDAHGASTVVAEGLPSPNQMIPGPQGSILVAAGEGVWKVGLPEDGGAASRKNGGVQLVAGGLHRARGLAKDKEGALWVTDYFVRELKDEEGQRFKPPKFEHGGVYRFSPEGKRETVWSPVVWPYSLAAGPDGGIYLAHLGGGFTLWRFDKDGTRSAVAAGIHWLRTPAFDAEGRIFVMGGHGISRIEPDGRHALHSDFRQDGLGSKHPVGLAFDPQGVLYSCDVALQPGAKGRIFRHAADGTRHLFCEVGTSPFYLLFLPANHVP